jgi:hypothetical protein
MVKAAKKSSRKKSVLRTANKDLALHVSGRVATPATLKRRETNGTLLAEAERALRHPGINRKAIFTGRYVSSYSVDPKNPRQFIRERSDGRKTVVRLVNGRFQERARK